MRQFLIECNWKNHNVVADEDELLVLVGEILSLVGQLDLDHSVTITCIDDE